MHPEDVETRIAERSGFFLQILRCLLLRTTQLQFSFFVELCIANPFIASNTTTNAVGCGEESTFDREKSISHTKPNKRAEEQELFGLPECS